MGIVRFAATSDGRVQRLGDDQRRLPASQAALLAAEVAAISISERQAQAIERVRILAGEYAAATCDEERSRIAGELANVKRAALGTRPVSEVQQPSIPMPAVTFTRTVIPGMYATGTRDKNGNPNYGNLWETAAPDVISGLVIQKTGTLYVRPNGMICAQVGASIRRRWSKHPHASQTWLYRSDSGSIHRVGNTSAMLVPKSLSETAGIMSRAYEPDGDTD